jgi:phosphatidylinositol alpha 1,6-mannosyltransferase
MSRPPYPELPVTDATRPQPGELRLALFTGNYNHILDGVSRTLNRVVKYLESQGIPVLVFGPTVDEPQVDHAGELFAVPSVPLPGRSEYRLSMGLTRTARAELQAFQPTLVHIATPDLLGLQALRWARRADVPVVSTYHTHFASYLQYYSLSWLEGALWRYARWFYSRCEQIYVPSQSMAAVLREHGIERGLRIWQRGVNTNRFHPRLRDTGWRRQRGIEDDEVVVLFVSRLVWEKGLDVYAQVIQRLIEEGRPVRALVVGDGPAGEELRKRLPESAVFTGFLGGDDLPRAYASADVFLFPSDTETFGNVTLEAMASGIPAVCADATGSNTLVEHGVTGYLAPSRQPEIFYEYTALLADDARLRRVLGAAGRIAAEPYDWDAVLARLLGFYREILAARAPLAPPAGAPGGNRP